MSCCWMTCIILLCLVFCCVWQGHRQEAPFISLVFLFFLCPLYCVVSFHHTSKMQTWTWLSYLLMSTHWFVSGKKLSQKYHSETSEMHNSNSDVFCANCWFCRNEIGHKYEYVHHVHYLTDLIMLKREQESNSDYMILPL